MYARCTTNHSHIYKNIYISGIFTNILVITFSNLVLCLLFFYLFSDKQICQNHGLGQNRQNQVKMCLKK